LPFCHVTLAAKKPHSGAYPKTPVTLGDHLRKRRFDLGLLQKDVALSIGVDTCTIANWERNHTSPRLYLISGIIRFLGYNPGPTREGLTFGERIKMYRKTHGLSQKKLARQLGVDPTTLARWEKDQIQSKGERTKEAAAKLLSMLSRRENPEEKRSSPENSPASEHS
jgi:transcriptional regulator with XRE-family HTH domain